LSATTDTEKRRPSDELLATLATNLKTLRDLRGLSQEKLGEKCGCHPTFISMVERKQRNVTISTLEVFAKALDVEVFQLLDKNFKCQ
jgi:transcriptional regulator with XRE-family HTH domain